MKDKMTKLGLWDNKDYQAAFNAGRLDEIIRQERIIKEKDAALSGMNADNAKLSQEIAELKAELQIYKDYHQCATSVISDLQEDKG